MGSQLVNVIVFLSETKKEASERTIKTLLKIPATAHDIGPLTPQMLAFIAFTVSITKANNA